MLLIGRFRLLFIFILDTDVMLDLIMECAFYNSL